MYSPRPDSGSRLDSFLLPSAHDERQVPEPGVVGADADLASAVERDLPRRRGQQVLAAQDVGDLHQHVVDRVTSV